MKRERSTLVVVRVELGTVELRAEQMRAKILSHVLRGGQGDQDLIVAPVVRQRLQERAQRRLDRQTTRALALGALLALRDAVVRLRDRDVAAVKLDVADAQHGELAAAHARHAGERVDPPLEKGHVLARDELHGLAREEVRALLLLAAVWPAHALGRIRFEHAQIEPLRIRRIVEELRERPEDVRGRLP